MLHLDITTLWAFSLHAISQVASQQQVRKAKNGKKQIDLAAARLDFLSSKQSADFGQLFHNKIWKKDQKQSCMATTK